MILIHINNINDNKCFEWCLVRYLNPADHNPRKITKADQEFGKRLDFKDIKFPVEIRDIFGYENKVKYSIYVSKNVVKTNMLIHYL